MTPSAADHAKLASAGLGYEKISFPSKNGDHSMLLEGFEKTYPKLKSQNGAFELLRAEGGGPARRLTLIPQRNDAYPIHYLKKVISQNTNIYTRPVQSNLSLEMSTPDDSTVEVFTTCIYCNLKQPLNVIRSHQLQGASLHEASLSIEVSQEPTCSRYLDEESSRNHVEESVKSTHTEKQILQAMFPDISTSEIENVLDSSFSIDHTAIVLSDRNSSSVKVPDICKVKGHFETLCDLATNFTETTKTDTESLEISVERDNIWMDSLKFYKKQLNDDRFFKKNFSVSFANEEGVDGSAMKMEFFYLLLKEIKFCLFEGVDEKRVPVKDIMKSSLFKIGGIIIAHSFVEGCPEGFPVLAEPIYHLLCNNHEEAVVALSIDLIPKDASTEMLLELITELQACSSTVDIDRLLYENNRKSDVYWTLISSARWPKADKITIKNYNLLIQELIRNELIYSRKNETDMFIEGLRLSGFRQLLIDYAEIMKPLFCNDASKEMTAEQILETLDFEDCRMPQQTQAKEWLISYLQSAQQTQLKKFLGFCTGYRSIPFEGLKGAVSVKYQTDDDTNCYMKSAACLKIIYIPVVYSSKGKYFQSIDVALEAEKALPTRRIFWISVFHLFFQELLCKYQDKAFYSVC